MSRSDEPSNPRLKVCRVKIEGEARHYTHGLQRVTLVPLSIRRRSNRTVLCAPPDSSSAQSVGGIDEPMIKTLGKAFYWQCQLDRGEYKTARDLARAKRLEAGWVAEVLRLTMLAPDIVEAILEGRQPRHLNLQVLRGRHDPLPRNWQEQRAVLGFTSD